MAREPMRSESEALGSSGGLLRYAAENSKDLPQEIVSTICSAWDAQQANTWEQKIATEFWLVL
jgi:hypothetical protein